MKMVFFRQECKATVLTSILLLMSRVLFHATFRCVCCTRVHRKVMHVLRALPPGTVPFPVKHLSGEGGEQRSGQGSLSGTGLRKPTPAHVAAQNS